MPNNKKIIRGPTEFYGPKTNIQKLWELYELDVPFLVCDIPESYGFMALFIGFSNGWTIWAFHPFHHIFHKLAAGVSQRILYQTVIELRSYK